MLRSAPYRSALISYAAGITAIAGLMAVVAFGGNTISAKRTTVDLSAPQYANAVRP